MPERRPTQGGREAYPLPFPSYHTPRSGAAVASISRAPTLPKWSTLQLLLLLLLFLFFLLSDFPLRVAPPPRILRSTHHSYSLFSKLFFVLHTRLIYYYVSPVFAIGGDPLTLNVQFRFGQNRDSKDHRSSYSPLDRSFLLSLSSTSIGMAKSHLFESEGRG